MSDSLYSKYREMINQLHEQRTSHKDLTFEKQGNQIEVKYEFGVYGMYDETLVFVSPKADEVARQVVRWKQGNPIERNENVKKFLAFKELLFKRMRENKNARHIMELNQIMQKSVRRNLSTEETQRRVKALLAEEKRMDVKAEALKEEESTKESSELKEEMKTKEVEEVEELFEFAFQNRVEPLVDLVVARECVRHLVQTLQSTREVSVSDIGALVESSVCLLEKASNLIVETILKHILDPSSDDAIYNSYLDELLKLVENSHPPVLLASTNPSVIQTEHKTIVQTTGDGTAQTLQIQTKDVDLSAKDVTSKKGIELAVMSTDAPVEEQIAFVDRFFE